MSHIRSFVTPVVGACLLLLLKEASGCVFLFGVNPDDPFAHPPGDFNYGFAGANWADGSCPTGIRQSPINLPNRLFDSSVSSGARTIMKFGSVASNGSNVKIFNNGHVVQVQWNVQDLANSDSTVAVPNTQTSTLTDALSANSFSPRVPITPLQFHFHAHSEHAIRGAYYPLEMHIVSRALRSDLGGCPASTGCLTVVGFLFSLSQNDVDNPLLTEIFDAMPYNEGGEVFLPAGKVLDLDAFLPSDRSYVTYSGSLTTPPCTEGVLWHVLLQNQTMSIRQMKQFMRATGNVRCANSTVDPKILTEAPDTKGQFTNAAGETCIKLGDGHNFRIAQPVNGRPLRGYIQSGSLIDINLSIGRKMQGLRVD